MDQETAVHLHNGILRSRKKEETPTFRDNLLEWESVMLSEISQAVKDE